MNKKFFILALLFMVLQGLGCESVTRKFIRQKPKPEHTQAVVFMEKGPYQKKFSNEYYYKMHYSLWKTWQDEILDNLGGNGKKLRRSSEEAYSNLVEMEQYLKPGKKERLSVLAEDLKRLTDKLTSSGDMRSQEMNMRSDLERLKRQVANDFYYEKVKSDLLPDNVDLGTATT